MKLPLSTTCLIVGLIGLIIGVLMNLRSLKRKAANGKLIFNYKAAFLEDWFIPAINFLIIVTLWLLLPYRTGKMAEYSDLYVIAFFGVIGIMGSMMLFSFLSSVNKRFNSAIAYKSDVSDSVAGTTGTPTPAEPNKK